jgi:hypothetical protein
MNQLQKKGLANNASPDNTNYIFFTSPNFTIQTNCLRAFVAKQL